MTDERAPSLIPGSSMGRRNFLGRTVAASAAMWAAPTVLSSPPVAAAAGSCSSISVFEFTGGLEGWKRFNNWPQGADGLWGHNSEESRDGGSLHYGRGTSGDYVTAGRNSGRVRSPQFDIPVTGSNRITFTVFREVDNRATEDFDVLTLSTQGGGPSEVLWSAGSDGGTGGVFESHTVPIPTKFNGSSMRFQFAFDTVDDLSNNHEGIYIGRFEVSACPSVVQSG